MVFAKNIKLLNIYNFLIYKLKKVPIYFDKNAKIIFCFDILKKHIPVCFPTMGYFYNVFYKKVNSKNENN